MSGKNNRNILPIELVYFICEKINRELLVKICNSENLLFILNKKKIQSYWKKLDIYNLIRKNDLSGVKYLVKKGFYVKAYNNFATKLANRIGHLEILQYLIGQGGDLSLNKYGY
jgi:hypothetical protein